MPLEYVYVRTYFSYAFVFCREISFRKGQLLHIIRQIDENWYEGGVDGRIGIFPVNYIEVGIRAFCLSA